jgi:hypothetical protein
MYINYIKIVVLIGSLAPPVLKAVMPIFLDIPQTSNKTVPALTLTLQ